MDRFRRWKPKAARLAVRRGIQLFRGAEDQPVRTSWPGSATPQGGRSRALGPIACAALALALAGAAAASEYGDGWGPPVDTAIPEASFNDQAGQVQTLAGLMGARGLLIFFNRSADW